MLLLATDYTDPGQLTKARCKLLGDKTGLTG
jgi:hypothetical protein